MDPVITWKEIARRRFRRLRQIGKLIRCVEAAAALFLFLSYSSTHVPAAARNSGVFLRHTAAFLISPRFVFLLGNAIVLVLLKSGHFSSGSAYTGTAIGEIYGKISYTPTQNSGTEDGENTVRVLNRACRRSRSEKLERRREEVKLRRAESECVRKGGKPLLAAAGDGGCADEEDDAEQFRRTIEEFIAKQQQFRREESLAVVAGSVRPEEAVP